MTAPSNRAAVVRLAFRAVLLALLILGIAGLGGDTFAAPKGAARTLSFSIAAGATQGVGAPWAPFTVTILKNGAVDRRDSKTKVTLSTSPGAGGVLGGTLTRTVSAGVAAFSGITYDRAETISLIATASDSSVAPVASNPVTVAAPYLQFNPAPGPTQVIGRTWAPFTVQVTFAGAADAGDNTTVVSIYSTGTGFLYGTKTKTVSGGKATFSDISYNKDEAIEIWAVAATYGTTPTPHVPVSVVASRLVFNPQPASPQTVGQAWAPFSVRIENGGVLDNSDGTTQIVVSRGSGTGVLSGTTSRTVAGGIATFDDLSYDVAETVTVQAAVVGGSWTSPATSSPVIVASGFSVTGTSPLSGATGVPLTSVVSATFSAPVDPASIAPATFTVSGPLGLITGSYSFADNGYRGVFTPATALSSGAVYTATLTTGVRSVAGVSLASNYTWSFTAGAVAAGWEAPRLIYSDSYGEARQADVAMTGTGRAVAAWAQYDPASRKFVAFASTLPLSSSAWDYPAPLAGSVDVSYPKVAADGYDNGVVAWQQFTATGHDIAAARFAGAMRSPAGVIASPGGYYEDKPGLAMSPGGFALALWKQYDPVGAVYRIFGSRCLPGSPVWSAPNIVSGPYGASSPANLKSLRAAVDDFADAASAWESINSPYPGQGSVFSNMFKSAGPWQSPYEAGYSDNNGNPDVALDSFGNPVVVWSQVGQIAAVRHNGVAWEARQTLSVWDYSTDPRIASGAGGGVLATVWRASPLDNGAKRYQLWTSRHLAGAWSPAMQVPGTNELVLKVNPQVAVDDLGNQLVVWQALDNSTSPYSFVYAARYDAATATWDGPVVLSGAPYAGYAIEPVLAGDARGNAVVVWRQPYGSYYGVFGTRYRSGR